MFISSTQHGVRSKTTSLIWQTRAFEHAAQATGTRYRHHADRLTGILNILCATSAAIACLLWVQPDCRAFCRYVEHEVSASPMLPYFSRVAPYLLVRTIKHAG